MKNNNKGITLIALVITVSLMITLAAVVINVAIHGNLFGYAGQASAETNTALEAEQEMISFEENLTSDQFNFKLETNGYTASLYGDANCDGVVNNKDVLRTLRYIKDHSVMTPVGKLNADVNLDGTIDEKDVNIILRYTKGGIPELPYVNSD